jgi:hypothetical protein
LSDPFRLTDLTSRKTGNHSHVVSHSRDDHGNRDRRAGACSTVTGFDGHYGGVSLTASGNRTCVAASPVPGPLTISGGNANTTQGPSAFQGTVNAQGVLSLHSAMGTPMSGKIDGSGTATAGLTLGSGCTYSFTWKKR